MIAERTRWFMEEYGRRQRAYRRRCPAAGRWKHPRRLKAMTAIDVQSTLEKVGISIPSPTLRYWASQGLIPSPTTIQNPKGRGRIGDWPEDTPGEAAAVWAIRNMGTGHVRATTEGIKEARAAARELMRHFETSTDLPQQERHENPDGTEAEYLYSYDLHPLIVRWIVAYHKGMNEIPISVPMIVRYLWKGEEFHGVELISSDRDRLMFSRLEPDE